VRVAVGDQQALNPDPLLRHRLQQQVQIPPGVHQGAGYGRATPDQRAILPHPGDGDHPASQGAIPAQVSGAKHRLWRLAAQALRARLAEPAAALGGSPIRPSALMSARHLWIKASLRWGTSGPMARLRTAALRRSPPGMVWLAG